MHFLKQDFKIILEEKRMEIDEGIYIFLLIISEVCNTTICFKIVNFKIHKGIFRQIYVFNPLVQILL